MTNQVSKSQFNARISEFIRQIEATGEPLIITDQGVPTLEIRRIPDPTPSAREGLEGTLLDDKSI